MLLAWGANSYGQLGLGHSTELEATPCRVPPFGDSSEPPRAVVGGGGHTLALDSAGNLFACGWNRFGQLGLDAAEEHVTVLQRVESVGGVVADIAGGWDFSLVLLDNGTVLGSGSNRYGQLGRLGKAATHIFVRHRS